MGLGIFHIMSPKDFRKDPQVEPKFCWSLLTTKFVDVAPIGVVIKIWNLSWWQQLCDVSKWRVRRTRRLLDQICMYCSKMNRRSCLYYQRIVHPTQIILALWATGRDVPPPKKWEMSWVRVAPCVCFTWTVQNISSDTQFFWKQS